MWVYIVLQFISITFQALLACYLIKEITTMKYSIWYILVNKLKYTIQFSVAGFTGKMNNPELNEPWEWLKKNMVYTGMFVKFITCMFFIFGLFHQMGSDQLMSKPKEFFIASPISNYAIIFIIYTLIVENKRLKEQNKTMIQQIINLSTGR